MKEVTKTQKEFIEYFGDDSIVFEQAEDSEIVDEYTVKPGSYFGTYLRTDSDGSKWYAIGKSVGPRLYYEKNDGSRIYGFMTAAHCVDGGKGQNVYFKVNGTYTKYGEVVKWKYSGCADAAFIKQTNTSAFTTSRYTAYSNSSGATSEKYKACQNCYYGCIGFELIEGATVYKCGKTTYLTKGKIKSLSVGYTINGSTFKNLVSATYASDNGDSGGIVFTIHNSNNNTYDVAGVHKGKYNGNAEFTSIDRYDNLNSDFGYWQY